MPTIVSRIAKSATFRVRFEYQPLTGGQHEVYVAGEFNGWDATATPMTDTGGIYSASVELRPGRYAYKFVVDGRWTTDEGADELASAGFDEQNAVVVVGDAEEIDALRKVTVRFVPPHEAQSVHVAGSWNAWNPTGCPMQRGTDGTWHAELLLHLGEYAYKFVVDGHLWLPDPQAELREDGFGGQNSILEVTLEYPRVRLERRDGRILTWGLAHGDVHQHVNQLSTTRLELRCRSHRDDVESITLRTAGSSHPMHAFDRDSVWEYWRCELYLPAGYETLRFGFVYRDGTAELAMLRDGFRAKWSDERMFAYDQTREKPFLVPQWARDAVFYQIFPDRFANGDPALNPDFHEWYYDGMRQPPASGTLGMGDVWYHLVDDWYDIACLKRNPLDPDGRGDWAAFYGGDLVGVLQKLDYLADLGVNAIYFNPVFQSRSTHRYDAADYMRVDDHLGGNDALRRLVAACHERGIRVILDCAFNHTGDTHMAFLDARQRGPASPFWSWYEFKQWPLPEKDFNPADYYQCWWGHGTMPDLDFDTSRPAWSENGVKDVNDAQPNWQVVSYILGLADFWLGEMDLDGFRLDVPNEVPWWFWELFRRRVKHVKPDAYLVGEIWHNASDWVNGVYFDAVMNYAYFRDPVLRFFCLRACSARTFDRDIRPGRLAYPTQAAQAMMNLLDSHDTHRVIESCAGDVRRLKLAVLFQMTYVGAPHVYYGDEIGMHGGHDPDNRRPFDWRWKDDSSAVELHGWYRTLIGIRNAHPALRRGEFRTLVTEGRVYAYCRTLGQQNLAVVLNNEEKERTITLPLPAGIWTDLLKGETLTATDDGLLLRLKPLSGMLLGVTYPKKEVCKR